LQSVLPVSVACGAAMEEVEGVVCRLPSAGLAACPEAGTYAWEMANSNAHKAKRRITMAQMYHTNSRGGVGEGTPAVWTMAARKRGAAQEGYAFRASASASHPRRKVSAGMLDR